MELLCPNEFGVFERGVQEKDIIFRFQLETHSFGHEDKLAFLLVLASSKGDEFIDPLFDQGLQPSHENGLELKVQLRNPDVKVRDLAGAELIDDFLDRFEFFGENFSFEGTGGERLDG